MAIRNRLTLTKVSNRRTKTYIRFSSGEHVIYLGFYIHCGCGPCYLPSAVILSNNRWGCNEHIIHKLTKSRSIDPIRRDARFYKDQFLRSLKKQGRNEQLHSKLIHSNRLGVSYTVTINKYNRGQYIKASTDQEKKFRKREKNRLRRLRSRNKKKKKLPPLPTGHVGDPRLYYQRTYNINLFDYKVRKRFNVSSIPQYNYGYTQARARHLNFTKRLPSMIIDTIPENPDNLITYVISDKDRSIINDPSVFLRRTPPPDDTSITTISDNSYASAAESVATVIYPPTPAGDSEDKTEQ
ncbi:hypothetical protein RhiirA4_510000 [Rhizophagus irregularis]|uniref:Uncharacterized protein n=1 Tax=Rhizophagus irregularis TaxID=588596 RepID=A0A2I1HEY8_9GLOM|nr:hypothetical protein RhiirA4_510000 [Rhizophagus irregularis]